MGGDTATSFPAPVFSCHALEPRRDWEQLGVGGSRIPSQLRWTFDVDMPAICSRLADLFSEDIVFTPSLVTSVFVDEVSACRATFVAAGRHLETLTKAANRTVAQIGLRCCIEGYH